MSSPTPIAFDLYGTLVSPKHARSKLISLFGDEKGSAVADLWRRYQLEYTWRLNSMSIHRPFDVLALGALNHAVFESGLTLSSEDRDELMSCFLKQQVFPDVAGAVDRLRGREEEVVGYIFSNGHRELVGKMVTEDDGELKGCEQVWKGFVTAKEEFKPARGLYEELLREVGREGRAGDVWLVTANPFDVVGARSAGLNVAWVDRAGTGWVDRLGDVVGKLKPTVVVKGVDVAVEEILKWKGKGE